MFCRIEKLSSVKQNNHPNFFGKNTQNIGVWISGHFGSGKSHLLKIISYILTNQRAHSDLIGELFLEKIDANDFELRSNIEKALATPSETILFNIDLFMMCILL